MQNSTSYCTHLFPLQYTLCKLSNIMHKFLLHNRSEYNWKQSISWYLKHTFSKGSIAEYHGHRFLITYHPLIFPLPTPKHQRPTPHHAPFLRNTTRHLELQQARKSNRWEQLHPPCSYHQRAPMAGRVTRLLHLQDVYWPLRRDEGLYNLIAGSSALTLQDIPLALLSQQCPGVASNEAAAARSPP